MNLNVADWKPFVTSRLFYDMQNGKANQQMLEEGDECFYVGAKKDDNGVMIHCLKDESLMTKGNCIIFICNGQGSVGYANYMDVDFIGTADIVAGYNDNLNPEIGAFLATVYSQERPKYSFGRKWKTKLANTEVNLPVQHNADGSIFIDDTKKYSDDGYVPDWQFMEDYIKSLHHKPLTTKNKSGQAPALDIQNWKEFRVGDIFPKKKVKHFSAIPEMEGTTPFVSSTSVNNGIVTYVDEDGIKGNCITVSTNGDCFDCFYQPVSVALSNDAEALYNANLNKYNAMFIISVLTLEKNKYGYGRKPKNDKVYDTIIKLPVDTNGNPDWQFMENYIKALPYGDRLEG